jgi:hypothetical protein
MIRNDFLIGLLGTHSHNNVGLRSVQTCSLFHHTQDTLQFVTHSVLVMLVVVVGQAETEPSVVATVALGCLLDEVLRQAPVALVLVVVHLIA